MLKQDLTLQIDTSNFEIDRPLPEGKNKKVIRLMKDKLVGQIMKEFTGLGAKSYSYLKDNDEDEKAKGTKKYVIRKKLKFEDYKSCLEAAQIENKINHLEKNKTDEESLIEFIKNNKIILKTQQRFKSERFTMFLLKELARLL